MKRERRNKIPVLLAFAEPLNVALTYYYSDNSPPFAPLYANVQQLVKPQNCKSDKKAPSTTALFVFLLK